MPSISVFLLNFFIDKGTYKSISLFIGLCGISRQDIGDQINVRLWCKLFLGEFLRCLLSFSLGIL